MSASKQELTDFYEGIIGREDEMRDIRAEIKDSFSNFATNKEIDPKALKAGFKFFKRMKEAEHDAKTEEFLRDKVVDVLLSEDNQMEQEQQP